MTETCRICLEVTDISQLISPCSCKGTQQYVHHKCLLNWQETAMDSFLTRPSRQGFANFHICNICKTPYKTSQSSRQLLYLSPHLNYLLDYYKTRLIILSFLSLSLLFFISIFIILLFYIILIIFLCNKHQMRPQLNNTPKGYRLGLIMFGKPVAGLRAGVILEASPKISKGIFAGSRILLTEYSLQKAIGFIVNKGISNKNLEMMNKEMKYGGPVKIGDQHILHNDPTAEGSQLVIPEVYLGGRVDLNKEGVKILKVNGHAEWRSLQLDGEITSGSWIIHQNVTHSDIFIDQ